MRFFVYEITKYENSEFLTSKHYKSNIQTIKIYEKENKMAHIFDTYDSIMGKNPSRNRIRKKGLLL
jgi:hypothetical protein